MRRLLLKTTVSLLFFIVLFSPGTIKGQLLDTAGLKKTILPIVYYLPETSLAFGASGMATFRFNGEPQSSKTSSIILGASYTLKNQILFFLPYEIYKNNEKIRYKGELGFYKYFYNFNGLGHDSNYEDLEVYEVTFPRLVFNYSRAVSKKWKLGVGIKFDEFNITHIPEGGLLERTQPIGYQGGTKSLLTLQAYTDTRDNTLSPYKGYYIEGQLQRGDNLILSDFEYWRFELDARYFYQIKKDVIFGTQLFLINSEAQAPFFDLGYGGDAKHARGFPDRRFINNNIIATQIEVRYPLFWRLRGATFLSSLLVPDKITKPFEHKANWAIGTGIRFMLLPEDRTSIRMDVGTGKDGTFFYLIVNEAF